MNLRSDEKNHPAPRHRAKKKGPLGAAGAARVDHAGRGADPSVERILLLFVATKRILFLPSLSLCSLPSRFLRHRNFKSAGQHYSYAFDVFKKKLARYTCIVNYNFMQIKL